MSYQSQNQLTFVTTGLPESEIGPTITEKHGNQLSDDRYF